MDLSIIIVNWNSADYTVVAIESVATTIGDIDHEILVVDNASTDDSRDVLARPLPCTTIIHSPVNLGFARANNLAWRQSRGRVLLFLNPDTRVLDRAISQMLTALESSPDTGAVGARLLNGDGTLQTSSVLPFPTIANQVLDAEWLRHLTPRMPLWGMGALFADVDRGPLAVQAVSGACLMVQREVFEQIRGFKEDYFLYVEDVDLCYEIHRAGFRVRHVPTAVVVHYGGGSSSQRGGDGFAAVLMRESTYRFLRTTRGPAYAARYRRALRAAALARIGVLAGAWLLPQLRRRAAASLRKWHRILRWSLGREPWTERLAPLEANQAAR